MPFPYEVPFDEVQENLDEYVDAVFAALTSDFLSLPRGGGFIDYPIFEQGYEALKKATGGFATMKAIAITNAILDVPIAMTVLRAILGFTPPEWAYLATQETGVDIPQNAARSIDKRIRLSPLSSLGKVGDKTQKRIEALVATACKHILAGAPKDTPMGRIHRLDKCDTKAGLASARALADIGVPYPVLLYERYLGRPFAGHRDAVSELVGDILESAIETVLVGHGVSYRKTKRAEKIAGFGQAPDFIIPSEFNPKVIIEAKLADDDGTARDKVTRVQQLRTESLQGRPTDDPKYQVVACIAGRGFGVRREDMKKLLVATRGKVFTLQNLSNVADYTGIREFITRRPTKSDPVQAAIGTAVVVPVQE